MNTYFILFYYLITYFTFTTQKQSCFLEPKCPIPSATSEPEGNIKIVDEHEENNTS